jgi:hypothetical protein
MACPPFKQTLVFAAAGIPFLLGVANAQVAGPSSVLPEGRWTGTVTTRTIPDHDKVGEHPVDIALTHCGKQLQLQFRAPDGSYGEPLVMDWFALPGIFVLINGRHHTAEVPSWVESQAWTLADARPNGWRISQSRAVLNRQMTPQDPWFTFLRFAWGDLEHEPNSCSSPATPAK